MAGYCELRGMHDDSWTDFDVDIMISDYEEEGNVVDGEAAGRSKLAAWMIRDPKGAFIGHKITFLRKGSSVEKFDALWDWIKTHSVDDYIYIRAAENQSTIEYAAYYTSFKRKLDYVQDGVNYWGSITVNFIPIKPTITPS